MREIIASIEPAVPSDALDAAGGLRYRDFMAVALIMKERANLPDNWIYVHDPSVRVGRIQIFKSWSPDLVPDPALCCYGMEYFCFEGDDLWSKPDAEVIATAADELARIGLGTPRGRGGRLRGAGAESVSRIRRRLFRPRGPDSPRDCSFVSRDALCRTERDAQVQQSGSRDDDRDVDGAEHHRGHDTVRRVGGERGSRVPGRSDSRRRDR